MGRTVRARRTKAASNGAATSSLPSQALSYGDEGVAAPFLFSRGAVQTRSPTRSHQSRTGRLPPPDAWCPCCLPSGGDNREPTTAPLTSVGGAVLAAPSHRTPELQLENGREPRVQVCRFDISARRPGLGRTAGRRDTTSWVGLGKVVARDPQALEPGTEQPGDADLRRRPSGPTVKWTDLANCPSQGTPGRRGRHLIRSGGESPFGESFQNALRP